MTLSSQFPEVFHPRKVISLPPISDSFGPRAFFVSRRNLEIEDGFDERILWKARVPKDSSALSLPSFWSLRDAAELGVDGKWMPDSMRFDETTVCRVLGQMLTAQYRGQPGLLEVDAVNNRFYLDNCFVSASWHPAEKKWLVRAFEKSHILKGTVYFTRE